MTNEEAIKLLDSFRICVAPTLREAMSVAINALTKEAWKEEHPVSPLLQKPATTAQPETHEKRTETHGVCLDVIDRQAAIKAIHEDADWLAAQGSDWQVERMERDKSILKSLPSAQPEPSQVARDIATIIENEQDMRVINAQPQRTGRWIHQVKFGRIECDQCGKVYRNAFVPKNYCPNCGASMTEKAEENDGTNER